MRKILASILIFASCIQLSACATSGKDDIKGPNPVVTFYLQNCSSVKGTGYLVLAFHCFNKNSFYVGNTSSGKISNVMIGGTYDLKGMDEMQWFDKKSLMVSLNHVLDRDLSATGEENNTRIQMNTYWTFSDSKKEKLKAIGVIPVDDWKEVFPFSQDQKQVSAMIAKITQADNSTYLIHRKPAK